MSDIAIKVENISKLYEIGAKSSGSLRDSFSNLINTINGKKDDNIRKSFWALKDISFEVHSGEVVGIIGKNGAGKSTLLKILSRITKPTTGHIEINGNISSLLEVGTGFHPELTGRENIYLNGTILGMKRSEIRSKFDEIVDFSGVEEFIDTPVKRYSSGMYVRLAFGVAAHLESEILIIDEILAVGDVTFQKKCLGKMKEISQKGRTVLFVSHNINAVEDLCDSCILIDKGMITFSGNVRKGINAYLNNSEYDMQTEWIAERNSFNTGIKNPYHSVSRFGVFDAAFKAFNGSIRNDTDMFVFIEGEIFQDNDLLNIGYALYDENELVIYYCFCKDSSEEEWPSLKGKSFKIKSQIPPRMLNEGKYRLELLSGLHYKEWLIPPQSGGPFINFEIFGGLSSSPYWMNKRPGMIAPEIKWYNLDI